MSEPVIAFLALLFAFLVVLIIHREIAGHLRIQSASGKAILAMEGVAIGVLFAGFVLSEVAKFAQATRDKSGVVMELTWHDVRLVLGTLLASLLIYVAIEKLQKLDK